MDLNGLKHLSTVFAAPTYDGGSRFHVKTRFSDTDLCEQWLQTTGGERKMDGVALVQWVVGILRTI
jgi:hypothetical protein